MTRHQHDIDSFSPRASLHSILAQIKEYAHITGAPRQMMAHQYCSSYCFSNLLVIAVSPGSLR